LTFAMKRIDGTRTYLEGKAFWPSDHRRDLAALFEG
jgi:hypothetical protein